MLLAAAVISPQLSWKRTVKQGTALHLRGRFSQASRILAKSHYKEKKPLFFFLGQVTISADPTESFKAESSFCEAMRRSSPLTRLQRGFSCISAIKTHL